jgi:hypothetical protein
MTDHGAARQLACHAASLALGADVVADGVTRHVAGVGNLETSCGAGWHGAGVGSNNIGAIQAGSGWTGATFVYTDTHPNPDGTSTPYSVRFRAYPTLLDGWVDLARVMLTGRRRDVLVVAQHGDTYSVSELMRKTGYYEGFGPTQHDRIRNHMLALRRSIIAADLATGVAVPTLQLEGAPSGMPQTVRFGDHNDAVKTLQRELGCIRALAADGIFGRITKATLVDYQTAHQLAPDGVCGPKSWQALFADNYIPDTP